MTEWFVREYHNDGYVTQHSYDGIGAAFDRYAALTGEVQSVELGIWHD